tara:strand:+ start:156 stop:482 length:327 start_codon:yes stop_codon:yes gene_type:complete
MGKRSQAPAPAPAPVPAPPPVTPAKAYGEPAGTQTPTEVLKQREEEKQAVIPAPPEPVRPKSTYLDNEDAARQKERELAGKSGRRKTRKTGPQGLLDPALVKKKGLMS